MTSQYVWPAVHVCESEGFVYVLLPSENQALRAVLAGVGVPFKAPRPAYRLTSKEFPGFWEQAKKLYPSWRESRTRETRLEDMPPWARWGAALLAAEARARKESMRNISEEIR